MSPYLKENEDDKEFKEILEIACGLFSKRRTKRENVADKLVQLGSKAVRPLVCTIEFAIQDNDMADDDLNEYANLVSEVVLKIGRDALPELEDFATNGKCNIFVNGWAQDTIFKVMGLEGLERQKVCHHFEMMLSPRKKRKMWVCVACDAEFEDVKNKTMTERREGKR